MKKLLFTLGVALAVLAGTATAAHAASPCQSVCDGKAPSYVYDSAACSDATVVEDSVTRSGYTLRLMYSWWCQTAWAETDQVGVTIRIQSFRNNGATLRRTEETGPTNNSFKYTRMVDDEVPFTAVACLAIPVSGGYGLCTRAF